MPAVKANGSAARIALLAKRPGITSFSSLYTVKRAFKTTKVGHTGTLDSFAQGLLVVCVGSLTRLAGHITQFHKTYEAIIRFGEETDTLEYTGQVVRSAPRPALKDFETAVARFTGEILQKPPAFSAIHINGKRSSDLARQGVAAEIPARTVTVYRAEILNAALDGENRVAAAHVLFDVSKGTYIRSLARDIAAECKSAAYLSALHRTKVGNFCVEDAAGFQLLEELSLHTMGETGIAAAQCDALPAESKETERALQAALLTQSLPMTPALADLCGFLSATLKKSHESAFRNGAKLSSALFTAPLAAASNDSIAVFTEGGAFAGLIQAANGKLSYGFVERDFY